MLYQYVMVDFLYYNISSLHTKMGKITHEHISSALLPSLNILLLSYIYILKTGNRKPGIVVIPTTQLLRKVEVCVSEVQGHPYLASEFKASVGYLRLLPQKE